jgi:hypothetical protein
VITGCTARPFPKFSATFCCWNKALLSGFVNHNATWLFTGVEEVESVGGGVTGDELLFLLQAAKPPARISISKKQKLDLIKVYC